MNEPRRITERYRLEKRISSKDSNSVFRAVDTLSGATVAVKLINAGDVDGNREAFEAHLATLQEIRHPSLPRILDFGRTTAGSLFLVTEYLDGDDLGDLVEIPPARVLVLLLQLVDGLEAMADRGLALRNLSAGNVRLVKAPDGEQVKILGLGSAVFLPAATGTGGDRSDLRAFAHLATETLGLSIRDDEGTMAVALPLEVAGALAESERLREILEAGLRDHPGVPPPDWKEVRQALRAAAFGTTGRPPAAPVSADDTLAVSRTGPAPAPRTDDFTTRVFRPDDLTTDLDGTRPVAPTPPPVPDQPVEGAGGRRGAVRIPLHEIEDASPPAGTLRFPSLPRTAEHDTTMPRRNTPLPLPTPIPIPPPVPVPAGARPAGASAALPVSPPRPSTPPPPVPWTAPSPAAAPLAPPAAAARPGMSPRRLALLIGVPVAVFLVVLALVAWLSRHSAQPEPEPVQAQTAPPTSRPAPPPTPSPSAPRSIHPQILLAEEALSSGDPQKARNAIAAILPEQIALFTAEEKDRYQQAFDALTPLQSQEWAERLKRGLTTGDLRLLRAAVVSPPAAAALTPEQKKDLTRARKILDLDKRLTRAQRAKDHPETLRQAALLLAELPDNARVQKARTEAAGALLAEADAHAGRAELDAALAALEHLREGWRDHPGLAERFERLRAERRVNDQMEEALAAAARAERPREGLEALDRVQPNERYAERFQQARERLQAQISQLDQNPPQISLAGPSDSSYEKGATVTVRLRVTDDQRIESVEGWVRPEGGRFTKVSVSPLGGSDYEIAIGPDLHQNRNIDFYVTAADPSGHTSSLGSVQRPQKIKRKRWFSKER